MVAVDAEFSIPSVRVVPCVPIYRKLFDFA